VIGETWTFLRSRAGHHQAVQFYDAAFRVSCLTITSVDEGLEVEA
jgi:hypothetical protein